MPRGGRRIPGPGKKLGRPKKLVSTLAVNHIQPADVGQMSLAYPRIRPEYELSEGQRHALIEKQGHRCAACGEPFTRTPCADHSHTTRKFRALLCTPCNTTIGCARESPERLRALAVYLECHGVRPAAPLYERV